MNEVCHKTKNKNNTLTCFLLIPLGSGFYVSHQTKPTQVAFHLEHLATSVRTSSPDVPKPMTKGGYSCHEADMQRRYLVTRDQKTTAIKPLCKQCRCRFAASSREEAKEDTASR